MLAEPFSPAALEEILDDFNEEKIREVIESIYDPLLNELPSMFGRTFSRILGSFTARKVYIKKYGFTALTKEFLAEIEEEFSKRGIQEFLELQAGTGFFTKVLNDYGFVGKGITLEIPANDHHWGLSRSPIYKHCVQNNLLVFRNIEDIQNETIPELVISSWIPYERGEEVINFFNNNSLPEYYLVIGEGFGGCTANDNFHEWLDDVFERVHVFETYKSFSGIHDSVILYKKKEK
jgi:hypothetical protein